MLCICCDISQQICAAAQTDALACLLASSIFIQKSLSPSPHLFFMIYHSKNKQTQNTFIKNLVGGSASVLQCVPLTLLTVESQTQAVIVSQKSCKTCRLYLLDDKHPSWQLPGKCTEYYQLYWSLAPRRLQIYANVATRQSQETFFVYVTQRKKERSQKATHEIVLTVFSFQGQMQVWRSSILQSWILPQWAIPSTMILV